MSVSIAKATPLADLLPVATFFALALTSRLIRLAFPTRLIALASRLIALALTSRLIALALTSRLVAFTSRLVALSTRLVRLGTFPVTVAFAFRLFPLRLIPCRFFVFFCGQCVQRGRQICRGLLIAFRLIFGLVRRQ